MAPTIVIALPTSGTMTAKKNDIKLRNSVQNIFYLLDIPSFLYNSSSIVFLQGNMQIGILVITEIAMKIFATSIKFEF